MGTLWRHAVRTAGRQTRPLDGAWAAQDTPGQVSSSRQLAARGSSTAAGSAERHPRLATAQSLVPASKAHLIHLW